MKVSTVTDEVGIAIQHLQNVKLVMGDHSGMAQANLELTQAAKAIKRAFRRVADLIVDDFGDDEREEPMRAPDWFK